MLSIPELIQKKRDGERLSKETIRMFVNTVVNGEMQDCQIGELVRVVRLVLPLCSMISRNGCTLLSGFFRNYL